MDNWTLQLNLFADNHSKDDMTSVCLLASLDQSGKSIIKSLTKKK